MLRFRSRPTEASPADALEDDQRSGGVDDAVLVAAARADPRAFTALYDRYLDPIYRYCYVRLGSREAAEDASSEVFLKALANLKGYRGQTGSNAFIAWLYRIAHNVVVDAQRKRKPSAPIDNAGPLFDPSELPEELVIAASEREALSAALRALPEEQRAAIELQLAGWSSEQIAATLGKSPGAVRMLRLRALQQLRGMLSGPESQGGRHAAT